MDEPFESVDLRGQQKVVRQINDSLTHGKMLIASMIGEVTPGLNPNQVISIKNGKATTFDDLEKAMEEHEANLAHSNA